MTITFNLAPIPMWVLLNNVGTAAGGATLGTFRSQNKVQQKPVFMDPDGAEEWTNPILFDLNGVQGPFYWEVNDEDLEDTYYLVAKDADGTDLWTVDDYFPPGSGGGGGGATYVSLINYITNNVFIDSIPDTVNPINSTNLLIAPSNHKGFTPDLINPVVTNYGAIGPDIRFVKNNTNATDQITFPLFPLGSAPLMGDVTPVNYVRYTCTNEPAEETYKSFQFPICQKVKNLSNQIMTFQIWAAVTSIPQPLNIYTLQYYGSGTAATLPVQMLVGSFTLTNAWTPYSFNFTVPDVSSGSLGTDGQQTNDDALYIQIGMPLGTPCDILFTKPALYLGEIDPSLNFESYDQINSINSTFRTGDIKTSLSSQAPLGWVPMNDGSIGNVGSLATTRANMDTFQLYKTLWDGINNLWAPVTGGRGASAIADFIANKALFLPDSLGRALAAAGSGAGLTARPLGSITGAETISIAAMPAHNHPGSTVPFGTGGSGVPTPGSSLQMVANASAVTIAPQGNGLADGNMPPTSFFNVFIKL